MTKRELLEFLDAFEDDEEVSEYEISRAMQLMQEARERFIEEVEEHQHASGFYAFQDTLEMYRRER